MAKAKHEATCQIEHDGKPYAEGDTIPLTDEQAAALIACGAVVVAGKADAKAPAEPAPEADAEQAE
ncbi:DUF7210 family protein [Denitromonas halophila]|uniref:DUF7210 domain-containing protein n=1 Tax=Denitromonas halophila TaxID=1629404 RepID=A0A557QLS6_9RHOO|nr:hypothetical protein [Denitromonas halophila]TVO53853.1 hypothetical protein FHP91_13735 [Denitromonas halophila]